MGQPNYSKGKRRRRDTGEAEQARVEVGHGFGVTALAANMIEGQKDGGRGRGEGGTPGARGSKREEAENK